MSVLYKNLEFDLKEEEKQNRQFEKILRDLCSKREKMEKVEAPVRKLRLDNCIVVLGLPVTSRAKADKIKFILEKKVLVKLKLSEFLEEIDLEFDSEEKTTGTAILRFTN